MDNYIPSLALQAFAGIGALFLTAKIFSFVRLLASSFVLPGVSVSRRYHTPFKLTPPQLSKFGPKGSWALVTGASDGIGKEFSVQLAKRGFNLVLVSRTHAKLEALEKEIKSSNPNTQTRILAMDFAQNSDSDYEALGSLIAGLDIAILVNNVGQSHAIPVPFVETDSKEINNIITINCFGTLRITQAVAPGMVQRSRGLILTMASFGGVFPTPLLATYSGSKAFLQQWGTALGSELAPKGITVEVVQSHLVTSAMSKIRRASLLVPTPKAFVRSTLGKIGRSGGSQGIAYTSTPYWAHGFYQWIITTFVGTSSSFTVGQNKTMHEQIRRRALAKAAREGKKGL